MKQFKCIWGDGYVANDAPALIEDHDLSWFSEQRGYWPEHGKAIESLCLGESVNVSEMGAQHSVVRIN